MSKEAIPASDSLWSNSRNLYRAVFKLRAPLAPIYVFGYCQIWVCQMVKKLQNQQNILKKKWKKLNNIKACLTLARSQGVFLFFLIVPVFFQRSIIVNLKYSFHEWTSNFRVRGLCILESLFSTRGRGRVLLLLAFALQILLACFAFLLAPQQNPQQLFARCSLQHPLVFFCVSSQYWIFHL